MVNLHHTFDICLDIANKLKHPEIVQEANPESELTLVEGLPGMAVFYGVIDQIFPDQGWDLTAYAYLKLMLEKIDTDKMSNTSLFSGLSGICFASYICSKRGFRYPQLLLKAENLLFSKIESSLFSQIDHCLDTATPIPPHLYNLSQGISGVLSYLLLRKNNPTCYRLARECLKRLILLLKSERCIEGHHIRAGCLFQGEQNASEKKIKHSNESYSLGIPYGIPGCLSILSLALIDGIEMPGQSEMIQNISSWLKDKHRIALSETNCGSTLFVEEEISDIPLFPAFDVDVWSCGTSAISRSLYLASQALRDPPLMQYSEDSFQKGFSKPWQKSNLIGTTINRGRAGLLALTYHMARDTKNPLFLEEVDVLEHELKCFYHHSHPFGFQNIGTAELDEQCWINHPGLLNGSAGIALSLLLSHSEEDMDWCRIFLMR